VPTWLLPAALAAAGLAVPALALRASRPAPAPAGVTLLRHGGRARTLVNLALGLPLLAVALAAWQVPPGEEPARFWPLATVASLAFLFLWIARIEVTGVAHAVTAEAFVAGSPWRKGAPIPWGDVAEVGWSAANQGFVLRAKGGQKVALSAWLEGLPAFAGALERHGIAVPAELREKQQRAAKAA